MMMKLLLALAAIVAVQAVVPIKPMHMIPTRDVPAPLPPAPEAPLPSPPKVEEPIGRIGVGSTFDYCSETQTINVTTASGTTGCSGVTSNKYITWAFDAEHSHTFRIGINGYQGSYIQVWSGTRLLYTYYPNSDTTLGLPDGPGIRLVYYTGPATTSSYGVSISYSQSPKTYHVVSGHTFNLQKEQQGGFVYFSLPYYALGALFYLEVDVYSYQGLQEPGVFVSVNNIPTLERYDYTNDTISTGDKEQMILYRNSPYDGFYVIGVFLYGSAARIGVTATWSFNVAKLTSGVKVSAQTSDVQYYQATVPVNTKQFRFQISRQVPGGYPVAYIAQGTLPSDTNYDYKADTTSQSYISIVVPDPNPSTNPNANPGNFIIAVTTSSGQAGYIIQADW